MFNSYKYSSFAGGHLEDLSLKKEPSHFSDRQDIKPVTHVECPKLSALELFTGLDSNEVLYLEHNILYYLREAIRNFMVEAKQSNHLS